MEMLSASQGDKGQVALLVAVDFTLSNGDPRLPTSLHSMDTTKPNDYVMAIRSVGEILQSLCRLCR